MYVYVHAQQVVAPDGRRRVEAQRDAGTRCDARLLPMCRWLFAMWQSVCDVLRPFLLAVLWYA